MDFTPPPGVDVTESRQGLLYGVYSLTFGLAILTVALRVLCRTKLSKAGMGVDDYLMCVALALATGNYIDMMIWVARGTGSHIYPLGYQGFSNFFINLFVCEILYTLSICFVKYSIIMFYWRIFGGTSMRIALYVVGFLVTGWGLGVIFTTIFQCLPVRGFWDKTINPTCGVNVNMFFIGNAVPNIITDWALLILPLPYIWKLQRNTAQKLAICSAFLVGGLICIISIVRLTIMLDAYKVPSLDVTWVFIGPSMWTAVEVNIGVVSACLPSLRPLLTFIRKDFATQAKASTAKKSDHGYSELDSIKGAKAGHPPNDSEIGLTGIRTTTTTTVYSARNSSPENVNNYNNFNNYTNYNNV